MFGTIDIEFAASDEYDYSVADYHVEDNPIFRAYELADEDETLAISNKSESGFEARESLLDDIEDETRYDAVWTYEVEHTEAVYTSVEVVKRHEYYRETPPERRVEQIPPARMMELLESRGIDVPGVDSFGLTDSQTGCWYFPEEDVAEAVWQTTDSAGESMDSYRRVSSLSDGERELLLKGANPEQEMSREAVEDIILENSTLYPREAEIASWWVEGYDGYREIANRTEGTTYQSVSQSCYNYRDRQEAIAFLILHVWPHTPENLRTEPMERILDALDAAGELEDVHNPAFYAQGSGRGGGMPKPDSSAAGD